MEALIFGCEVRGSKMEKCDESASIIRDLNVQNKTPFLYPVCPSPEGLCLPKSRDPSHSILSSAPPLCPPPAPRSPPFSFVTA